MKRFPAVSQSAATVPGRDERMALMRDDTSRQRGGRSAHDDDHSSDTDRLWLAGGAGMVGLAAWAKRDVVVAAGAPYGLSAPNRVAEYGDYSQPWTVTGWRTVPGYHITAEGWVTLGAVLAVVVAALVCVGAAVRWSRWRRDGGIEAVPAVPVVAAAVLAAAALLVAAMLVHLPFPVAWGLASVCGVIAGLLVSGWGRRYRLVAAFAGRAEQVLGHGQPGRARLRARAWRHYDDGGQYPGTIEATTGPGWQHTPAEMAALGRYTTEMGWPAGYQWRHDPLSKELTGTAPQQAGAV